MKEFLISGNEANQRLDKYLAKLLDGAPKSFSYKMLRKKNIVLNGKKASGSERLREGDCVKLFLSDETYGKFSSSGRPVKRDLSGRMPKILYEDPDVIFLDKPAGMLSQKAVREDISLVDHLNAYLLESGSLTEEMFRTFSPSICNRLDRNTSGIVTAGKSLAGLQTLSRWFRERLVKKYYLCLVAGTIRESRRITGYLIKDGQKNEVRVSSARTEGASFIETEYRPAGAGKGVTLLEVHLITGKTHQIRAHLSAAGHPIVGDPKYGDPGQNRKYRDSYGLRRQLLHAYRLETPGSDQTLPHLAGRSFTAPLPEDFKTICEAKGVEIWRPGIREG